MRFRWKLLLLMLLVALAPFVAMRWLGVKTIRNLENKAVQQMEQRILATTQKDLRQLTRSYSELLAAWVQSINLGLTMQAQAVENALAKTKSGKRAVFVQDFQKENNLPLDYGPSPHHFIFHPEGSLGVLRISFNAPVISLAPGTRLDQVQVDIGRLTELTPSYRQLNRLLGDMVYWHYTSLTNGLYSVYPGHGNIPPDFDHRQQQWFQQAIGRAGIFWSTPFVNPDTGQIVMAGAKPVHRPDGEVAGVTALIVPVTKLTEQRHLIRNMPPGTHSFIAYTDKQSPEKGLRILIDNAFTELDHRNWRLPLQAKWLRPDDDAQWQSLFSDIEEGVASLKRMNFKGQDSLWVYAKLPDRQTYLFLITPFNEIMKPVITASTQVQRLIDNLIRNTRYGVGLLAVMMLLLALAFSRSVTRPIRALAKGAQELAQGNFACQVSISSRDEFGELGKIFNTIGPQLQEKKEIINSLLLAREVQQNLLPQDPLQIPGLDIAARSVYCDETGGDYFDFVRRGDTCLGLVIGDVSGHGISSALLMTTARAFIRLRSSLPGRPDELIADVNRQLVKDIKESGSFMTLFYSEIDTQEHTMRWVRAGHDPALLYEPRTDRFTELKGEGMALGVMADAAFTTNTLPLQAEQILLMGTDGIWECNNPSGELYGKNRLRQLIRIHYRKSASEIRDYVLDALHVFRQAAPQKDDITLLVVKIKKGRK